MLRESVESSMTSMSLQYYRAVEISISYFGRLPKEGGEDGEILLVDLRAKGGGPHVCTSKF